MQKLISNFHPPNQFQSNVKLGLATNYLAQLNESAMQHRLDDKNDQTKTDRSYRKILIRK
ncbi:hypothetical protein CJ030_MR1G002515 [Morella rubra]|uniref:Uncharacterized protein n=1 Tax=Morella rubra TaxID=262757 RepID=A0A6A1WW95_9ROSI|nr:hypothetical protein CJ030_MR1G002515 [Morella rubra]